jgi:hypothetical protein
MHCTPRSAEARDSERAAHDASRHANQYRRGFAAAVDGKAVVRMEDDFGTDAEDLWSAPTDPQRLARMCPGRDEQTVIEVELFPDGDQTRLVLEERGLPLNEAAAHGAGRQAHVEDLAAHLAGRPTADWQTRWADVPRPAGPSRMTRDKRCGWPAATALVTSERTGTTTRVDRSTA